MHTETEAILMSGSNLGNRIKNLQQAATLISERAGKVVKVSSVYRTEPWNMDGEPEFLNQALLIRTSLSARELLAKLLKIEQDLGRVRTLPFSSRTIDLDIISFGTSVINENDLVVPHPRFHLRRFNLLPINEIYSEWKHPLLTMNITELLENCTDKLKVVKLNDNLI